jgi:hypothetical protein
MSQARVCFCAFVRVEIWRETNARRARWTGLAVNPLTHGDDLMRYVFLIG